MGQLCHTPQARHERYQHLIKAFFPCPLISRSHQHPSSGLECPHQHKKAKKLLNSAAVITNPEGNRGRQLLAMSDSHVRHRLPCWAVNYLSYLHFYILSCAETIGSTWVHRNIREEIHRDVSIEIQTIQRLINRDTILDKLFPPTKLLLVCFLVFIL